MFPLMKFSHHTGPCSDRSHTWTHVNNRNDLDLTMGEAQLIDEFANHVTRSWMKVTSGSEVLVKIIGSMYQRVSRNLMEFSGISRSLSTRNFQSAAHDRRKAG